LSLASFTNEVGTHDRYEFRQEESHGMVYDSSSHSMQPYDHIDDSFNVLTGRSIKPSPIHGDHKTAYDYSRQVYLVVDDKPWLAHQHYDNPVDHLTSNYDYNESHYISKEHTVFSYDPVDGPELGNALDRSVTQALNHLQGESAQAGADLGDMRATVEGLSRDVMRAASFIRNMRHGRWQAAANSLGITPKVLRATRGRELANYWLEYQYGWRPLAKSMYDYQNVIHNATHRKSFDIVGKSTVRISGDRDFLWDGRLVHKAGWTGLAKTVLFAHIDNPMLASLNELGLTNPISIAWELVPFSFVVDWFIPIGNTLSALSSGFGLTFNGGYSDVISTYDLTITRKTGYSTPWVDINDGGHYQEKGYDFHRWAYAPGHFPNVRLYANLQPFSTTRAANALALVRQYT
jgi:hypothetical protein